jgi:hypothetical protein
METFGKFMLGVIMIIIGTLVSGFMLFKLWAWFVLPVFESLPQMTFSQSVGLSLFLTIVFYRNPHTTKEEQDFSELIGKFLAGLLLYIFLFGFAWIVYLIIK